MSSPQLPAGGMPSEAAIVSLEQPTSSVMDSSSIVASLPQMTKEQWQLLVSLGLQVPFVEVLDTGISTPANVSNLQQPPPTSPIVSSSLPHQRSVGNNSHGVLGQSSTSVASSALPHQRHGSDNSHGVRFLGPSTTGNVTFPAHTTSTSTASSALETAEILTPAMRKTYISSEAPLATSSPTFRSVPAFNFTAPSPVVQHSPRLSTSSPNVSHQSGSTVVQWTAQKAAQKPASLQLPVQSPEKVSSVQVHHLMGTSPGGTTYVPMNEQVFAYLPRATTLYAVGPTGNLQDTGIRLSPTPAVASHVDQTAESPSQLTRMLSPTAQRSPRFSPSSNSRHSDLVELQNVRPGTGMSLGSIGSLSSSTADRLIRSIQQGAFDEQTNPLIVPPIDMDSSTDANDVNMTDNLAPQQVEDFGEPNEEVVENEENNVEEKTSEHEDEENEQDSKSSIVEEDEEKSDHSVEEVSDDNASEESMDSGADAAVLGRKKVRVWKKDRATGERVCYRETRMPPASTGTSSKASDKSKKGEDSREEEEGDVSQSPMDTTKSTGHGSSTSAYDFVVSDLRPAAEPGSPQPPPSPIPVKRLGPASRTTPKPLKYGTYQYRNHNKENTYIHRRPKDDEGELKLEKLRRSVRSCEANFKKASYVKPTEQQLFRRWQAMNGQPWEQGDGGRQSVERGFRKELIEDFRSLVLPLPNEAHGNHNDLIGVGQCFAWALHCYDIGQQYVRINANVAAARVEKWGWGVYITRGDPRNWPTIPYDVYYHPKNYAYALSAREILDEASLSAVSGHSQDSMANFIRRAILATTLVHKDHPLYKAFDADIHEVFNDFTRIRSRYQNWREIYSQPAVVCARGATEAETAILYNLAGKSTSDKLDIVIPKPPPRMSKHDADFFYEAPTTDIRKKIPLFDSRVYLTFKYGQPELKWGKDDSPRFDGKESLWDPETMKRPGPQAGTSKPKKPTAKKTKSPPKKKTTVAQKKTQKEAKSKEYVSDSESSSDLEKLPSPQVSIQEVEGSVDLNISKDSHSSASTQPTGDVFGLLDDSQPHQRRKSTRTQALNRPDYSQFDKATPDSEAGGSKINQNRRRVLSSPEEDRPGSQQSHYSVFSHASSGSENSQTSVSVRVPKLNKQSSRTSPDVSRQTLGIIDSTVAESAALKDRPARIDRIVEVLPYKDNEAIIKRSAVGIVTVTRNVPSQDNKAQKAEESKKRKGQSLNQPSSPKKSKRDNDKENLRNAGAETDPKDFEEIFERDKSLAAIDDVSMEKDSSDPKQPQVVLPPTAVVPLGSTQVSTVQDKPSSSNWYVYSPYRIPTAEPGVSYMCHAIEMEMPIKMLDWHMKPHPTTPFLPRQRRELEQRLEDHPVGENAFVRIAQLFNRMGKGEVVWMLHNPDQRPLNFTSCNLIDLDGNIAEYISMGPASPFRCIQPLLNAAAPVVRSHHELKLAMAANSNITQGALPIITPASIMGSAQRFPDE